MYLFNIDDSTAAAAAGELFDEKSIFTLDC